MRLILRGSLVVLCLLISGRAVIADEEVCGACGGDVRADGNFAHYKVRENVAIEGANGNDAAFREEINGTNFSINVSHPPAGRYSVAQAKEALCGFTRVHLKRGETTNATVDVAANQFRFWDILKKQYIVEPGEYELLIGPASDDIRRKAALSVVAQ